MILPIHNLLTSSLFLFFQNIYSEDIPLVKDEHVTPPPIGFLFISLIRT
ncbi:MAG: hypothetical protein IPL55_22115 [Saprospiraceae bacterium]|nr:hypothetical protein [Saprospiraceae bacterium]